VIPSCVRRMTGPVVAAAFLADCATPATQVMIPTESMDTALEHARGTPRADAPSELPARRPIRFTSPPGAPEPMFVPPDVRMAYLYEWVDTEGNKHFGGWVAIPLAGFDWLMLDGSTAPLGHTPSQPSRLEQP
jgi:hypothetical protein